MLKVKENVINRFKLREFNTKLSISINYNHFDRWTARSTTLNYVPNTKFPTTICTCFKSLIKTWSERSFGLWSNRGDAWKGQAPSRMIIYLKPIESEFTSLVTSPPPPSPCQRSQFHVHRLLIFSFIVVFPTNQYHNTDWFFLPSIFLEFSL